MELLENYHVNLNFISFEYNTKESLNSVIILFFGGENIFPHPDEEAAELFIWKKWGKKDKMPRFQFIFFTFKKAPIINSLYNHQIFNVLFQKIRDFAEALHITE